jgi:uncharacterized phage protein gp47/JayE
MAGITPEGFETKRLTDIQASINERAIAKFGSGINLEDDSLLGQLRDIVSFEISEIWDALQATYDSGTPSKAENVQLDDVTARVGVSRLDARPSSVPVVFTGQVGASVPSSTLVAVNTTQEVFSTITPATLSGDACHDALVDITVVANSSAYSVTINSTIYNITSGGSATANAIATALAAAINADTGIPVTASVVSDRLKLVTDVATDTFSVLVSIRMSLYEVSNPVLAESVNTGRIQAPVGQLIDLKTSLAGVTSATNYVEAELGRNRETDTELRLRRARSLAIAGTATLDAIVARVGQLEGITAVTGFENRTNTTIDSLPPHSFEIVAQGSALDEDIAQAIWDNKPAGIETYGLVTEIVTDSSGTSQYVKFTRPVEVPIYVHVDYDTYSEEIFPSNGVDTIKELILAYGSSLSIGENVIAQRFFGSIYAGVPGIQNLSITLNTTVAATPYANTIIAISPKQIPVFDLARISVVL